MDIDDVDAYLEQPESIENIEEKLAQLDDLDNETRLEVFYQEINHFIMHGIQPNDDWYEGSSKGANYPKSGESGREKWGCKRHLSI